MKCRNCEAETTEKYQYCKPCVLAMYQWFKEQDYRLQTEERSFKDVVDFIPLANDRYEYPEDDLNNFEYLQRLHEGV